MTLLFSPWFFMPKRGEADLRLVCFLTVTRLLPYAVRMIFQLDGVAHKKSLLTFHGVHVRLLFFPFERLIHSLWISLASSFFLDLRIRRAPNTPFEDNFAFHYLAFAPQ